MPPSIAVFSQALIACLGDRKQRLLLEPGRSLIGNAGILLARVEYLKHGTHRNFAVLDATMNDLIRPRSTTCMARHPAGEAAARACTSYDVVGPIYESGDFLGHDRELNLAEGDLVAIMSSGAYGMTMSSTTTRDRARLK
jgi:diaminopimelate decarboxylase